MAYQKLATASVIILQLFDTPLFAANGKITHTMGSTGDVSSQLGGHSLPATSVVLASDCEVDDLRLDRNFLLQYKVLVDLTARNIGNS